MPDADKRLARMEGQLDKMAHALTKLAEVEVHIANFTSGFTKFEERLRTVELNQASMTGSNKWVERIAWAIVVLGLAYYKKG